VRAFSISTMMRAIVRTASIGWTPEASARQHRASVPSRTAFATSEPGAVAAA
jgi:hypothetical protein